MLAQALHIGPLLAAAWFLVLSLSNIAWLRLSSRPPRVRRGPMVSVLVPARDEERSLPACLDSLLAQSYEPYEIIVLDDESGDATGSIARRYAAAHPRRVRAVAGRPLGGGGWAGKPHAMQQLAGYARGEVLVFTDADTVHGPHSIAWAVTNLRAHRVDLLSGFVRQVTGTLGEAFVVPATYIMSAMILPLWLVPVLRAPGASFAVGQLIAFRRGAFESIGGWERVRGSISDDLAIAREVKKAGFREAFLDLRDHVRCRMYEGYRASFAGFSKNVYDFARHRSLFFAAALTVLAAFVLLPLVLLPLEALTGDPAARGTLLSVAVFLGTWSVVLWDRGMPWWSPLLYPVLFGHMVYMGWWAIVRAAGGRGVQWKGRRLL